MPWLGRLSRNRKNTRNESVRINPAEKPSVKGQPAQKDMERTFVQDPVTCFSLHISHYIGHTVTVFVKSGGVSGCGFTGVLLDAGGSFIKLLSCPGPPPACPLGNACMLPGSYMGNQRKLIYMNCSYMYYKAVSSIGSVTYIPVDKIASFVHSSIGKGITVY